MPDTPTVEMIVYTTTVTFTLIIIACDYTKGVSQTQTVVMASVRQVKIWIFLQKSSLHLGVWQGFLHVVH